MTISRNLIHIYQSQVGEGRHGLEVALSQVNTLSQLIILIEILDELASKHHPIINQEPPKFVFFYRTNKLQMRRRFIAELSLSILRRDDS